MCVAVTPIEYAVTFGSAVAADTDGVHFVEPTVGVSFAGDDGALDAPFGAARKAHHAKAHNACNNEHLLHW